MTDARIGPGAPAGAGQPGPRRTAVGLALFYYAVFTVIGVNMPFWPVWLESRGLDAAAIGLVVSIGMVTKVVANPLITGLADRVSARRALMVALAVLACAGYASMALAEGVWGIAVAAVAFFFFWSPLMPLAENLTMLSVRRSGLEYGRIRLWGSIAFIVASAGAGAVLHGRSPDLVWVMVTGAVALTAVAGLCVPPMRVPRATGSGERSFAVLRQPAFLLFLAAAAFTQASHTVYFGFGSLHWKAAGHSETVIGLLWAEGVAAEVLLFLAGARLVRRIGPVRLIGLGAAAAMVRWTGTALTDHVAALAALQALHAFTFGATHLGAMHFIAERVDARVSASAQGIYSSAVMGLALGGGLYAAGYLYGAFQGHAFLFMTGSGAAGLAAVLALRALERRARA